MKIVNIKYVMDLPLRLIIEHHEQTVDIVLQPDQARRLKKFQEQAEREARDKANRETIDLGIIPAGSNTPISWPLYEKLYPQEYAEIQKLKREGKL